MASQDRALRRPHTAPVGVSEASHSHPAKRQRKRLPRLWLTDGPHRPEDASCYLSRCLVRPGLRSRFPSAENDATCNLSATASTTAEQRFSLKVPEETAEDSTKARLVYHQAMEARVV